MMNISLFHNFFTAFRAVLLSILRAAGKRRNMAESNYKDLGQKFKSEIENALSSGDFKGLNDLVSDTVNMAVSDAANKAGQATENFRQGVKNGQANMQQDATYRNVGPQHDYQPDYYSYVNRKGEVEYRRGKYDYRRPDSERRVNKTQELYNKHYNIYQKIKNFSIEPILCQYKQK